MHYSTSQHCARAKAKQEESLHNSMPSDMQDSLEEIDRKLQLIAENAFLSKLDLMFSVLVSLTIFGVGLALNNISSVVGLPRTLLISILVLMIYTLVGEFLAILRDDAVERFAFWMSLIFGICTLGAFLPAFAIFLFPSLIPLFFFFPFVIMVFLGWLGHNIDDTFTKYTKRLPSRRFPFKAWGAIWKQIRNGYLLFAASLIVSLLIFGI